MKIRLLLAAGIVLPPLAGQVRFEDIARGPNESWLTYAGDYGSGCAFGQRERGRRKS